MISGSIERDQWHEAGETKIIQHNISSYLNLYLSLKMSMAAPVVRVLCENPAKYLLLSFFVKAVEGEIKKLYDPFLWMGFDCLKSTEPLLLLYY